MCIIFNNLKQPPGCYYSIKIHKGTELWVCLSHALTQAHYFVSWKRLNDKQIWSWIDDVIDRLYIFPGRWTRCETFAFRPHPHPKKSSPTLPNRAGPDPRLTHPITVRHLHWPAEWSKLHASSWNTNSVGAGNASRCSEAGNMQTGGGCWHLRAILLLFTCCFLWGANVGNAKTMRLAIHRSHALTVIAVWSSRRVDKWTHRSNPDWIKCKYYAWLAWPMGRSSSIVMKLALFRVASASSKHNLKKKKDASNKHCDFLCVCNFRLRKILETSSWSRRFSEGFSHGHIFRNVSQTKVVFACLVSRLIVTQARQGSDCS